APRLREGDVDLGEHRSASPPTSSPRTGRSGRRRCRSRSRRCCRFCRPGGPLPQSLAIKDNKLSMGTGTGIMIASPRIDGSTVTGNRMAGSGPPAIYVASPAEPNTGKHVIHSNTVTGYRKELFIDLTLHPDTVPTDK